MEDKESGAQVPPVGQNIGQGKTDSDNRAGQNVLQELRASVKNSEDNARLGLGERFLPIDGFRPEIRDILNNAAEDYDAHRDKCVLAALMSVAMVTGYKVSARMPFQKFTNHAGLYGLLIDVSGGVKTAINKFFLSPVEKLDRKARRRYKNAIDKYNALTPEQQKGETKPVKDLMMTQNYTPERLTQLDLTSTTGVSFYKDELSGFYKAIGKYSASGKSEIIEQQLTLYDNILEANDRVSDMDELAESRETSYSTYGTIQPSVFDEVFVPLIQSGNGYFNRFFFVFPEPRKHRYVDWQAEVKSNSEEWEAIINDINQCPAGTVYQYEEAARYRYAKYLNEHVIEAENKDLYSNDPFTAYLTRNRPNILRLVITIHVLNDWRSPIITDQEMDMAIKMMVVFNEYAKKCLDRLPSPKRSREVEDSPAELIKMAYRMNMAKGKPASAVNQSALAKMVDVSQAYVNKIKSSMISSGEITDDDSGDSNEKPSEKVEETKKDKIAVPDVGDETPNEESEISPETTGNEVHGGDNAVSPDTLHNEEPVEGEKPPTPPLPPDKAESEGVSDSDNSKIPPDDDGGDGYAWK